MTTQQVADRLVELSRQGKFETAQQELYADDATSIEPADSPGLQTVTGKDKIISKGHDFQQMLESVHRIELSEPVVAADFFSISILMDVTIKQRGRENMNEIAVYRVKGGKIVSEQFFYGGK